VERSRGMWGLAPTSDKSCIILVVRVYDDCAMVCAMVWRKTRQGYCDGNTERYAELPMHDDNTPAWQMCHQDSERMLYTMILPCPQLPVLAADFPHIVMQHP
jgi:hypothetical protein